MATLLLSAAGGAVGGALGGGFGAAALGATIGRAAGALAGGLIDQKLLGGGGGGGVDAVPPQVMSAREGAPVPRVYGRYRIAGTVIWTSGFRQQIEGGGGKNGDPGRSSFSISLALGLCEGPIDRIGRIWADGNPLATGRLLMRLHHGGAEAQPDPLIEATEGAGRTPGYRGLAYLVIENLNLAPFGNRIPQLQIEVFRQPHSDVEPLKDLVRAVALSPGSGEFSLNTTPVRRVLRPGAAKSENVNNVEGRADLLVSLDQLRDEAPQCRAASLVVSWFGDDLRCGTCQLTPRVEQRDKRTAPVEWSVAGLSRETAPLVSETTDGRPVFGGTPSDQGVMDAIREMRDRGVDVMFYPFILMDIPARNARPDPYGAAEQPAFPWRGRITLSLAPGQDGGPDQSAAAGAEVATFFGAAEPSDFAVSAGQVSYTGPEEWSLRRMVLHYAALCAAAGGVDAFCIGSELRGLTRIRSGRATYPAVEQLRRLARDVRALLGEETRIGYAADWSEYFGHQPNDGSGDAIFHLDPLWSDPAIDFIGVDNYAPLTDWRDGDSHLDREIAHTIHDPDYLASRIESGEGYDWHYASEADRRAQIRTPIHDSAHGEHWMYRPKDFHGWWSHAHHNRIGGARQATATAWTPRSKPIWFTELGCAAVDKGANQPNVFIDAKSSESALPHFSTGARDDHMQRRFLEANLRYWADPAHNPKGEGYSGDMIDMSRCFIWTWDARPWPDFPQRREVWGDWPNHRAGHWITGRLGAVELAPMVREICAQAGLTRIDVDELDGIVDGFAQMQTAAPRDALASLALVGGFDVVESGGRLCFVSRHRAQPIPLAEGALAAPDENAAPIEIIREGVGSRPGAIRFGWRDSEGGYAPAVTQSRASASAQVDAADVAVAISADYARMVVERWGGELNALRESARFALPEEYLGLEPGDVVRLAEEGVFRIDQIGEAEHRLVVAMRVAETAPARRSAAVDRPSKAPAAPALHPVEIAAVETRPGPDGDPGGLQFFAFADPWPGRVTVRRALPGGDYELLGHIDKPAVMGTLAAPLASGAPGRWDRGAEILVRLHGGALHSAEPEAVLAGANVVAVETVEGQWKLLQFCSAELVEPRLWRLRGLLRRYSHAPAAEGARLVLLNKAGLRLSIAPGEFGEPRRYRIGPVFAPPEHESQTDLVLSCEGWSHAPLPPAHLKAARPGSELKLSWSPCDPQDRDLWRSGAEDGLTRSFQIQIIQEGALVMSAQIVGNAWTLDAARAAQAGLSAPFEITVAEIVAGVGAGPEARIVVNG